MNSTVNVNKTIRVISYICCIFTSKTSANFTIAASDTASILLVNLASSAFFISDLLKQTNVFGTLIQYLGRLNIITAVWKDK